MTITFNALHRTLFFRALCALAYCSPLPLLADAAQTTPMDTAASLNFFDNPLAFFQQQLLDMRDAFNDKETVPQLKPNRPDARIMLRYAEGKLLSEMQMVGNVPHGPFQTYFPNGSIQVKAMYVNGMLSGEKKFYYLSGTLSATMSYVDNVLHGDVFHYFTNGNLQRHIQSVNGVHNGARVEYFISGKLRSASKYVDGKKNGITFNFHSDGRLVDVFHYSNNKLDGAQRTYYSSGYLKKIEVYENKKFVSEKSTAFADLTAARITRAETARLFAEHFSQQLDINTTPKEEQFINKTLARINAALIVKRKEKSFIGWLAGAVYPLVEYLSQRE